MNNHMQPLTSSFIKAGKTSRRITTIILAALLALVWLACSFGVTPVKAESEASSEAGLEAPAYLRRRRRNRNYQQQRVRQERNHEAQERNKQQRQEKKQLSHGPQIKSYQNNHRRRQGQQGQTQPTQP